MSAVQDLADAQKRYLLQGATPDEKGKINIKRLDLKLDRTYFMFPNRLCTFLSKYFLAISTSPTSGMNDIKSIIESRRRMSTPIAPSPCSLTIPAISRSAEWCRDSGTIQALFALDLIRAVIRRGRSPKKWWVSIGAIYPLLPPPQRGQ